jgi:hypothetical protein
MIQMFALTSFERRENFLPRPTIAFGYLRGNKVDRKTKKKVEKRKSLSLFIRHHTLR